MKVELNKSYVCRDGKVRKVVSIDVCSWNSTSGIAHFDDGKAVWANTGWDVEHDQEVIREFVSVEELITMKTVTKEVFVYDGQEYETKEDLTCRVRADVYTILDGYDTSEICEDQLKVFELFVKLVRELKEGQ